MKNLFLVFLCSVSLCNAQRFKVFHGDTFQLHWSFPETMIHPSAEDIFFTYFASDLSNHPTDLWLSKLDGKTAKYQYKINLHDSSGARVTWHTGYHHKATFVVDEEILLFSKFMEKDVDNLVVTRLNSANGKKLGAPVVLFQMSSKGLTGVFDNGICDYHICLSDNKNVLLVISQARKNYEDQNVNAHVFDVKSLKLLWTKKLPASYGASQILTSDYRVSDQGKVHFVFEYLRSGAQIDRVYGLGMAENADQNTVMYPIPHAGRTLVRPSVRLHGERVSCHGTYLDGDFNYNYDAAKDIEKIQFKKSSVGGFYNMVFDENLKLLGETFTKVDEKFNISTKRLEWFDLSATFWVGDVGYVIRDESYSINTASNNGHLIVDKIDINGKLLWQRLVPRRSAGDFVGLLACADKKLQLFYYDNPANIKRFSDLNVYDGTKYKVTKKLNKASLVCVTVSENGDLQREVLDYKGYLFLPNSHPENRLIADKTFVVKNYARKKKRSFSLIKAVEE